MLSEERLLMILNFLEKKRTVTVSQLVEELKTSESTIRRDLNYLDKINKLKKVHGGAMALNIKYETKDDKVEIRKSLHVDEKIKIAKFAAKLIEENDFVYIDAGTTTSLMIDYITETKAKYITNGIEHAKKLIKKNCQVYILGGELKFDTEAIVGVEAINSLNKYNFTKGFFGTNGIDKEAGVTTPDIREALVKRDAVLKSKKPYVLCDQSKFNNISSVTFSKIEKVSLITTKLEDKSFNKYTKILEADNE
ncbi:DeoR/GlpR family DNA-binding transcription regulator [Haloimpatiens sp. FM7315]|uniref:DeoR/GlpR family DNA-binding transcription regulator n=1 Tax=Haloimpatiens sp. FM7315 TaxID=3298609 RepID=UPI00370A7929